MMQNLLELFKERGYFHQCTDEEKLAQFLNEGNVSAYIGFDCTANSLHVGSLVQIMILKWLEKLGHTPIILLGTATTQIGDPTGKDESRPVLSDDVLLDNINGIKSVFKQFGLENIHIVYNHDWIYSVPTKELLQLGRHFSVNKMLTYDSVKARLDKQNNLTLTEFLYMVIQAYDFTHLNTKHNCRLQIGGSDQWANITNGTELNKKLGKKKIFGLTTPLITTSNGTKMGKTSGGAVWLTEEKFSSYDYWQFWRNTKDEDVIKFLKLFTFLDISVINELAKLEGAALNEVKITLANEATAICHGAGAAILAYKQAMNIYGK